MSTRRICFLVLLCVSSRLCAQTETHARFQVYGGYTFLSNSFNGIPGARQPLNGWDASIAFPDWHNLRFKADCFAYRGTNSGAQQNAFFVLGGGQYSRRLGRESVFVEGLVGDGGINRYWGPGGLPGEIASFATVLGGGIDTPVSRRFAWRVNGGYMWSNFWLIDSVRTTNPYYVPGLPRNFFRLSSGVVWNF